MKSVLVLLSSYNGEHFIDDQINSLLNQIDVNVHILIRDDGSSDATKSIVKKRMEDDHRITLIEGENAGFAKSFMLLAYEAFSYIKDYDYFAFCDQDDIWLPDKLIVAVDKLDSMASHEGRPKLYWSYFTLVDEQLNEIDNNAVKNRPEYHNPLMSKSTILVRYFMLGCTMVFDRNMIRYLYEYKPEGQISMHDLWLSQTAIFLGDIVYDENSHILYRQHTNNTAGVNYSFRARLRRFKNSFKTYERRHFREINAKNLLSAYRRILSPEDIELISIVANYRDSLGNRIRLLRNKDINMGQKSSDLALKARIILGLF